MRVLLLCFSFLILLVFSPTIRSKLIINTPWFSNVGKAGIPSPGIQSIPAVFRYPASTSPLAGGSTRWIVNTPLEPPPGITNHILEISSVFKYMILKVLTQ